MMNLIPTPDILPAPVGIFYFLLILTLPLHLVMMNAMLGSAIISLHQHFTKSDKSSELSHLIAKFLPLTIAFAVNLGVAPLLFLQVIYGNFIYVSSIMMGAFWIAIYVILIIAYYASYLYDFKFKELGKSAVWILTIAVIIILFIAFLFTNNMTLMLSPEKWSAYFLNKSGTILNTSDSTLIPRLLHFLIASIAIGGVFVALLGKMIEKKDRDLAIKAENTGMKAFFIFTIVQLISGIWFLISLPRETMLIFMGKNTTATIIFIIALVFTVALLYTGYKKKTYAAAIFSLLFIYLMVIMRDFVRSSYLKNYFSVDSLKVNTEISPILLFAVSLFLGIYLIYWLIKQAKIAFSDS